jgi:hypothetical protein
MIGLPSHAKAFLGLADRLNVGVTSRDYRYCVPNLLNWRRLQRGDAVDDQRRRHFSSCREHHHGFA